MCTLKIDISSLSPIIEKTNILSLHDECSKAYKSVIDKSGKGNDFLGWVDIPVNTDNEILTEINAVAGRFKNMAEVVVVVGIGGSYLGAKAVIEALNDSFSIFDKKRENPVVIYAGQNISSDYMSSLIELLNNKDYGLVVISKSGTTTEPAIAFRILKKHIENKYGKDNARKRIIAVTDREKGALKKVADNECYQQFVIPDDVGGRFSVLTPVGLLPIAVAGFDIMQIIAGARIMRDKIFNSCELENNPAALYACARTACYRNGYDVELLVNYEPSLIFITEWWKQLYGESEGKENKGIFPAGVSFTTDLHSMGQYIQQGRRVLFESVLTVEKSGKNISTPSDKQSPDGLEFLAGKDLHEINRMAELGTLLAHTEGGVPNLKISIPEINEFYLGEMIYFFEFACALSGYMLGVNPFDQPGVEDYKKNMFALLGKPGFEKQTEEIRKKVGLI